MINSDGVTKENNLNNNPERNANWQQALDNLYILFIVGGSGY